jgi:hypothetical protein
MEPLTSTTVLVLISKFASATKRSGFQPPYVNLTPELNLIRSLCPPLGTVLVIISRFASAIKRPVFQPP